MKAYFTASIAGKKDFLTDYQKIINHLRTKNCEVISDHIINSTESEIRLETREDRLKFHKQLETWVAECDFIVAETSFPSISVGYEIALAQYFFKPTLVLYKTGDPPSLLAHHENEKIVCEKYSVENLSDLIEEFINYVRGSSDSRFTFFISSKIAAYLDKISKIKKVPKSVYLRNLIEKDIKNHR